MGATNVQLAYARWSHLPDRAFRLLAFMCLVSMDGEDPPRFWQGRESMALALGRMVPDEPADSDVSARAEAFRKARRADFEAVKSALRDLRNSGVVVVHKPAARGRNAVYALHLLAATGKGEPVERGRVSLSTGKGEPVNGVGQPYPLGERGERGEDEETKSPQVVTSPAPSTTGQAETMNYSAASRLLQTATADLGAYWMSQVPDDVVGYEARVLAAAQLFADSRGISPLRAATH